MAQPNASGYPQHGYGPSPSPYPTNQGGYSYSPQQGQYPPQQGQNPPQQNHYHPQQGQYPQQQGPYPPHQGPYQPQQGPYQPQQGPYQPQQGPYPPQSYQYSPQQGAPQSESAPPMGFLKPETAANLEGRATPSQDEELPAEGTDATPTAPPIDSMAKLPGYEGLDFTGGGAPPPPPAAMPPPPKNYGRAAVQHEVPSELRIREIVAGYVAEHCCYGKGPITNMKIVSVTPTPAMKYTLESMTEMRSTRWQFVPWRGEPVAPPTGPPPAAWDMIVTLEPAQWFKNLTSVAEVPNTQTVRVCHDCKGLFETRCTRCHGRGFSRCTWCHGHGRRTAHGNREHCTWCHGRGSRRCTTCNTSGMVPCPTCEAQGNIRCYVELTIKWQNHEDMKVVERTDLPDDFIKTVSGQEVFRAEEQRVHPILGFPDRLVSESSQQMVQKHAQEWPSERIFRQRHVVQSVPVFCVTYHCDGKQGEFFIYGNSQKIHFPDYPNKCCCVVM